MSTITIVVKIPIDFEGTEKEIKRFLDDEWVDHVVDYAKDKQYMWRHAEYEIK